MTPDRWRTITDVFEAAIACDGSARAEFIARTCKDDAELRAEVEALVAAHNEARSFGNGPRPDVAVRVELSPGTKLGPYRIDVRVGSGGMGEVYRARDTRLDRTVAIKILPRHLRNSTDREARFEREARTISRLTHPHICTLYDIGREGDIGFIVMEYLEGETLAARLARGPVPFPAALLISAEIASALAHAHGQHVVHRDLKPSNVMITGSGAKLLDFGLAKLRGADDLGSPSTTKTAKGVLVGTLPYMSPEQLQGMEADVRADIWALGCVLYELVTGRRAFEGTSQASLIAAIMERDPVPLLNLQPLAPPLLDHVVRTCLAKDRDARWQSAADIQRELQWIAKPSAANVVPGSDAPVARRSSARTLALFAGMAVLALTLIAGVWRMSRQQRVAKGPVFKISTAVDWPSAETLGRLSPDGNWLAFISDRDGDPQLFVRNIRSGETTPVGIAAGTVLGHAWSADGQELAILVRREQTVTVQIVPAFFGGPPRTIGKIEEPARPRVVRWIGSTVYIEDRSILLGFDIQSGAIQDILRPDPSSFPFAKAFDVAPDRRIVFSAVIGGNEDLWLSDGTARVPQRLTDHPAADGFPVFGGDYVFFESSRGGQTDVWRLRLDDRTLLQVTSGANELQPEDASADGALLSATYSSSAAQLRALDPRTRRTRTIISDSIQDLWPSISRNGTTIAYQRRKSSVDMPYIEGGGEIVVGRWDGAGVRDPRVAAASGFAPRVSSDGRWIAYLELLKTGAVTIVLRLQELATSRTMTVTDRFLMAHFVEFPLDWLEANFVWSQQGSELVFCDRDASGASRVRSLGAGDPNTTRLLLTLPVDRTVARDIWPTDDGRRLAYSRSDGYATAIIVRDLESGTERVWRTEHHGLEGRLQTIGWDTGRLLVLRSKRIGGVLVSTELLALEGPEVATILRRQPHGYPGTARLDPERRRVVITLREDRADNLYELPLDSGPSVRLTSNDRPYVSFSNVQILPGGTVVYTHHDRKQDIWLVRQTEDR